MYYVHGMLMLLSWILFIPVATFIKRYFKYSKKEIPKLFLVYKLALLGAAICISCSWLLAVLEKSEGDDKYQLGTGHPHRFFAYISIIFFSVYFSRNLFVETEEPPKREVDYIPNFNTAISSASGLIAYLYFLITLRYVTFQHESRRTEGCSPFLIVLCVWFVFFVAFQAIMTMYFYWAPWALGTPTTGYLTFAEVFYQRGFWIANLPVNKLRINLLRAFGILSVAFAIALMTLFESQ